VRLNNPKPGARTTREIFDPSNRNNSKMSEVQPLLLHPSSLSRYDHCHHHHSCFACVRESSVSFFFFSALDRFDRQRTNEKSNRSIDESPPLQFGPAYQKNNLPIWPSCVTLIGILHRQGRVHNWTQPSTRKRRLGHPDDSPSGLLLHRDKHSVNLKFWTGRAHS
jgi:hypothetical protein